MRSSQESDRSDGPHDPWLTDVEGRDRQAVYGDGSQVKYLYENTTSRVRQIIDEKLQTTPSTTISMTRSVQSAMPIPSFERRVSAYIYDPNYKRIDSMSDGTGTTLYSYIHHCCHAGLGASRLASVEGPLTNDTITYGYDELGRLNHTSMNGVNSTISYDAAGPRFQGKQCTGGVCLCV